MPCDLRNLRAIGRSNPLIAYNVTKIVPEAPKQVFNAAAEASLDPLSGHCLIQPSLIILSVVSLNVSSEFDHLRHREECPDGCVPPTREIRLYYSIPANPERRSYTIAAYQYNNAKREHRGYCRPWIAWFCLALLWWVRAQPFYLVPVSRVML